MPACKKCGENVRWATVLNGKHAGKKRPFDVEGSSESGNYGLAPSGEINQYGKPEFSATYYDDPVEGFERNELLYTNHFDTCKEKGEFGGGGAGSIKLSIELNGRQYTGTVYPAPEQTLDV